MFLIAWLFAVVSLVAQPNLATKEPTEMDARKFLETKLENEAEGRIGFRNFRGEVGAKADYSGKVRHTVHFYAELGFSEPCVWIVEGRDSAFSFRTFVPSQGTEEIGKDQTNALEVSRRGMACLISGLVFFDRSPNGWLPIGFAVENRPKQDDLRDMARVTCLSNLKQVLLAFRVWAGAHSNQFIFNVSTNLGGTRELCSAGASGFDQNAVMHLREMKSKYLVPGVLVCPGEIRQRAKDMPSLSATNVSYQLRSGSNVTQANPKEILLQCPIHGTVAFCDGSVRVGNK